VLLAVDDIQWLDVASAEVLGFVFRRLREETVATLVTLRAGTNAPPIDCDRVELLGLDAHDLLRLLRTRLGLSLPPPVVERIRETSAGNPFFALEIARELKRGNVRLRPGEPVHVPSTLTSLLEARVGRVSPIARRVLLTVAAAATTRASTLAESIGPEAATGIDEAVAAELLVRQDEELRFSHPLLRSTVYDLASVSDRRLVHRRLARYISDGEEQARHLALAANGPDRAIAEALDDAAGNAAARGAFASAAELAEQAAELTPRDEPDALWLRLGTAAEQHFRSGDFAAAHTWIEAALTHASTSEQRAASTGSAYLNPLRRVSRAAQRPFAGPSLSPP
jgi:predicted ATPase